MLSKVYNFETAFLKCTNETPAIDYSKMLRTCWRLIQNHSAAIEPTSCTFLNIQDSLLKSRCICYIIINYLLKLISNVRSECSGLSGWREGGGGTL